MISQDHDSALDEPVLDLVGTAFADVHLDQDAADIVDRGRKLRRRRQAMPVLATAGILAASLSIAAVTQTGTHATSPNALSYNGAVVNVDEAGFSVHTDAKTDSVTVTLHSDDLVNAKLLRQVLAKAGIPSLVRADTITSTTNTTCTWRGAKDLDYGKAVLSHATANDFVTTINRSALPPGSVVAFEITTYPQKNGNIGYSTGTFLLSNMPTGCTK